MQNKAWFCLACSWILNCYRVDQSIASAWNGHFFHSSPVHSSESNRWHFSCLEEMIEGLKYERGWGGGRCCCPFTFPLTHLQNLSAFFFPFDSITSDRLMNNWLVVSVLRLTDWLCLLMAAPPLCAAMMWLFSLGSWQNGTFFFSPSLKTHIHTHTQSKRRCWTQNGPDHWADNFVYLCTPRGLDTCRTACMSDALEPAAFRLFSPPAFLYGFCDGMCSRTHAQKICTFIKKGKREIFFFLFEL